MTQKTSRFIWADAVRILAIFFVVLLHSSSESAKSMFPITAALAATCIPLFVILSGALLLNKTENYNTFYRKRLFRIMLPWISWTLIYSLIKLLQNPNLNTSELISLVSSTFTSFWFLPMITALYILTPFLRIFIANSKLKDVIFILILWFLGVSFLPYYNNSLAFPFSVDNGIVRQTITYFGFYLLGYLLITIKSLQPKVVMVIFTLGLIWSLGNFYFRIFNHFPNPFSSFNYIFPGIIILSASIFLFIKSLDKKLSNLNKRFIKIVYLMSSAALGIYFLHGPLSGILSEYFKDFYPIKYGLLGDWINATLLFFVSFLIIFVLAKFPFVKKFIT
jgi:surface polysaccharide O-acyltransferase-like enzyme